MFTFQTNSNPFGLDHIKFLTDYQTSHMHYLHKMALYVHVHRNHLIPYYPKEPLLYPHLRNLMRFSDTTQNQIPQIT